MRLQFMCQTQLKHKIFVTVFNEKGYLLPENDKLMDVAVVLLSYIFIRRSH